ncbi:Calx-beta domain-containing protein [Sphingomonas faeni]|uniref:Calx-beta domain-containing protein n=1 Tax=Sphingomonas faeni TaxID=185950 RepID=UPI00277EF571|nr:Calx-beta domain-containing protein [Sphingomonas faeni]MDQ0839801.1 Ca2+-binding RTX toxin-like protein [Sphingomonas faeni]
MTASTDSKHAGTRTNDAIAPQGPQPLYSTSFDGFTGTGFAPDATSGRLNSNVFRILGLSDLAAPAYGFTSPTVGAPANDFGRGVILGSADPTSGGVYSPSANAALVIQPTGSDFVEGNGAIEARIQNTTGFTATSFEVAFDWAYRNSGGRADGLQLSYSSDGVSFTPVSSTAFTTPGAADTTVAASFTNVAAMVSISDVVVADSGYLYLRWGHTGSSGSGNRDEIGIDNLNVRAGVTDAPTLTFSDVTIEEGNSGTRFAALTLTRTDTEGTATVNYTTANGTALVGSDYRMDAGVVTFNPGIATVTIQLAILGDTRNEPNESFFVNFSSPQGFLLPDNQARVTIINDDTGPVSIYDIQGLGHRSTYEGLTVQTSGVVTALRTNGSDRGYYLQDATGDGDSRTSDAIFVATGSVSPTVAVGNAVTLTGNVTEYTANAANLTITRLTGTTGVTVTTAAAALPAATLISTEAGGYAPPTQIIDDDRLQSYEPSTDGIDYYESLEGMMVTVRAPLVVSATDIVGQTYVVANQGIGATGLNERFGLTISAGDNGPEKIKIYAPGGGTFDQGDVLGDVTGILTYFGNTGGTSAGYELDPIGGLSVTTDRPAPSRETSTLVGDLDHMTIASFNVENADPGDGAQKFQLIATEVTQALRNPDVIGLQEIQDADGAGTGTDLSGTATAQSIIDAIVAAGGPRYRYTEVAPSAPNTTGGEPGGNIRNGYLYNPDRVSLVDGSVRLIEDQAFTGSRRPLVATFGFNGEEVTVVNAHSTSRGGSDTLFGANQPPAQAGDGSRTAQANAIKSYIDTLQAANVNVHVATLGDFNGYYYETALSRLTDDGRLTNLYTLLPVEERYSYLFEGYLQAFDNIIVSNNLLDGAAFDVVHYNAEQPDSIRITDHDQALAKLYIPRANTAPTNLTISASSVAENLAAGTVVGTVTGQDAEGGALSYSLLDDAGERFAINGTTGEVTTRTLLDYEATPTVAFTARVTDAGGLFRDQQFTVTVTDVNPEIVIGTDANETIIGGAGDDLFLMGGGNDRLYGGIGSDQLFGGEGNDLLDGGMGVDFLNGGAGDDRYVIDNVGDQISEFGGSGIDTVMSSISYVLGADLENLVLTGTAAINATGNDGANYILGNAGNNVLAGGAGDDTIVTVTGTAGIKPDAGFDRIDGGSGIDTLMLGGVQSDYHVLNADGHTFLVTARGATEVSGIEQGAFGFTAAQSWSTVLTGTAAFDGLSYIAGWSDLRAVYGTDAAAGQEHFLQYGFTEGRSLSFNALDYIASWSDLRLTFGTDATAGARHFIEYGATENRDVTFDGWTYLASYSDLIQTYGANETAAAEHYIRFGADEGRATSFDAVAYAAANVDLAAAFGTDQEALARHYVTYGYAEGRALGPGAAVIAPAALVAVSADTTVPTAAFVDTNTGHHDTPLFHGEGWLVAPDVTAFETNTLIIA